ncbi:MAG: hypothetical protein ABR508_10695 [Candidatus Baltobacteraceae bacterium]
MGIARLFAAAVAAVSESCSVLFVSNGHGEIAIAARIARELPAFVRADHLALVGEVGSGEPRLHEVGPRRSLPSGGLIAMANVRNIARDLAAGLLMHTLAQLRFLRGARGTYDVCVAVGDVFALLMAQRAHARKTVFAGTAKSVFVAPYGAMEERAITRADAAFVRDAATAQRLRDRGIAAQAANVIVDLYAAVEAPHATPFEPAITIFPGSRSGAYEDAVRLCRIVRVLARTYPRAGAALSVAPGLDAKRMAGALAHDGWHVERSLDPPTPFVLYAAGRPVIEAWTGPLQELLASSALVLGQAGTANEAAAAAGIPVVAWEHSARTAWYRKRQMGLLGDALLIVRGTVEEAAREVAALLRDAARREAMGTLGRERMGASGGAARIAAEIVRLCG